MKILPEPIARSVEEAHDVFDNDVPDHFEPDLRNNKPDDNPLEPRRMPDLQLILEHLEHPVKHFQALVDDGYAVINLEVFACVPEDGLP